MKNWCDNNSEEKFKVGLLLLIPISFFLSIYESENSLKIICLNFIIIYWAICITIFGFFFFYLIFGILYLLKIYYPFLEKFQIKKDNLFFDFFLPFLSFYIMIGIVLYFVAQINILNAVFSYKIFIIDASDLQKLLNL